MYCDNANTFDEIVQFKFIDGAFDGYGEMVKWRIVERVLCFLVSVDSVIKRES